jgi:predicted DNA-binding transcriptional regulator AlpA
MADELVSGAEIGRRLGVSRETVRKWAKQPTKGFPEPLARVGRSVVWNWAQVARWAEANGIKSRGAA